MPSRDRSPLALQLPSGSSSLGLSHRRRSLSWQITRQRFSRTLTIARELHRGASAQPPTSRHCFDGPRLKWLGRLCRDQSHNRSSLTRAHVFSKGRDRANISTPRPTSVVPRFRSMFEPKEDGAMHSRMLVSWPVLPLQHVGSFGCWSVPRGVMAFVEHPFLL